MIYSQSSITVSGNNVTVVPSTAAGYREVIIQNRSDEPVFILCGNGANVAAANGEVILSGGFVDNDGTAGVMNVDSYTGIITAACAASADLSILIIQ